MTTALAMTVLAACSSSKKEDPAPATREINWTADGAALKTTTLQSQKLSGTLAVAGTVVTGTNPTYLSLQFPDAVGTYAFGPSSPAWAAYTVSTGSTGSTVSVYYAGDPGRGTSTGSGTIVVTARTATEVTGTFSFVALNNMGDVKSVTNGKFNVGL